MMFMVEPKPIDGFRWTQTPWGRGLICDELERHAAHLFTVGDLELRGDEGEWLAVARFMGVPRERLRLIGQVHGADIAILRKSASGPWTPPRADGIASDDDSVALAVRVADCAPLLIADTTRPVVAAVHAGWRGTLQGIAGAAVASLEKEFGSRADQLVAAIGPCLGACCGEMGPEVVEMFRQAGYRDDQLARWFEAGPSGKPHFDLWTANREQLEGAGLRPAAIFMAGLCTRSHPDVFHSYRAEGANAGRMLGIIRPKAV